MLWNTACLSLSQVLLDCLSAFGGFGRRLEEGKASLPAAKEIKKGEGEEE